MADKYRYRHPASDGAALVLDIVRCTIFARTEHDLRVVLSSFEKSNKLTVRRLKNLFKPENLDAQHLRRMMLNVEVVDNGICHICECQLHLKGKSET